MTAPVDPAGDTGAEVALLRAALQVATLGERHLSVPALGSVGLAVIGPVLDLDGGALLNLDGDAMNIVAVWSPAGHRQRWPEPEDLRHFEALRAAALGQQHPPEMDGRWCAQPLGVPGAPWLLVVRRDRAPLRRAADQRLLGALASTLQAALERAEQQAALTRAHHQLQHTVSIIPALLMRLDAAGRTVLAEGQALAVLDPPAAAWMGGSLLDRGPDTPWRRYARAALDGRSVTVTLAAQEQRYETQFLALRTPLDEPDGVLMLGYDVTAREQAHRELSALLALASLLERPADLAGAVTRVLAILAEVLNVTWLAVWRCDTQGQLDPVGAWPTPGMALRIPVGTASRLRAGQEVTLDEGSGAGVTGAALLLPVWAIPGGGVAALGAGGTAAPLVTPAQHALLLAAARTLRSALQRDHAHQTLHLESRTDALTGLLNRRQFDRDVAALQAGDAVVLVDVDHFKDVNDTHGHAAGDAALREVARRLTGALRRGDHAYRYGGEEFAVLLHQVGAGAAWTVAERLRLQVAATPMLTAGRTLTVSVGVSVMLGGSPARTLQEADRALYQAKAAGRNQVCLW